jgi:hypothetical protein
MSLTRKQLEQHGIKVHISKRDWRVTSYDITAASGNIGREYNARNKARKAAMDAAHSMFVMNRITGDDSKINIQRIFGYATLSSRQQAIWANMLLKEVEKDSFISHFLLWPTNVR